MQFMNKQVLKQSPVVEQCGSKRGAINEYV